MVLPDGRRANAYVTAEALASTLDMKEGRVLFNPAPMTEMVKALAESPAQ